MLDWTEFTITDYLHEKKIIKIVNKKTLSDYLQYNITLSFIIISIFILSTFLRIKIIIDICGMYLQLF